MQEILENNHDIFFKQNQLQTLHDKYNIYLRFYALISQRKQQGLCERHEEHFRGETTLNARQVHFCFP